MDKLEETLANLLNKKSSSKELKKALAVIYDEADRRRKIFEGILSSVPDLVFLFDRDQRLEYANESLLEKLELDWEEAAGKTIEELDAEDNLPLAKELQDEIDQVFKVGKEVRGLIYSKDKTRAYDYILVPVLPDHQPQMVAGSCRDITDRLTMEQELEEELNDMHRLHEISTQLINDSDIDTLLNDLLDASIEIMNAEKGYLQIIEEGSFLRLKSYRKFSKDFLDNFKTVNASLKTTCSQALKQKNRIIVSDIQQSKRISQELLIEYDIQAAQSTPLISRTGRVLGMISTHWRKVYEPTQHQLQMLDLLAREAADLIENLRSEEALQKSEQRYRELSQTLEKRVAERTEEIHKKNKQLKSLTAELVSSEQRERQKFSSILHDDLQQLLVSAGMHLSMIKNNYHDEELETIIQIIEKAKHVTRNLSKSLSSQKLYERGLESALHWLKKKMKEYHYLDVKLDVEAEKVDDKLDVEIGIMLFECIRELLLNVVKHAHVDSATLKVYAEEETLRVFVGDDGEGFDPETLPDDPEESFGLYNVKKRIEAIGGLFELNSEPGNGTRVKIEVPFSRS